eukprot:63167-Karenia_brevis.AAC.1
MTRCFPAGLANVAPETSFDLFGKQNLMRIALGLHVAKTVVPSAPPHAEVKRPWLWNTPDRVVKSKKVSGGTEVQYFSAADLEEKMKMKISEKHPI